MTARSNFDEGMRTRLPPNVTREKTRHGRFATYYRVGKGPRTRLPDFGSEGFDEAYQAALRGNPVGPIVRGAKAMREGTLSWLVTEYKKSLHYRSLDADTQRRRDRFFDQMCLKSGDRLITQITEQTIVDAREKRTGGRGFSANNFLKAIKPMFAYAKTRGWVEADPARHVDYVKAIKGTRLPWTIEDVQKYEERHPVGTMANLAMKILLFTGFRRGDAVLFGRQHIREGIVHFRPGKTESSSGVTVTFTALPPLVEAIAATETGDLTFLLTEHGRPFTTGNSFGNWFQARCIEAKIAPRAHGLRKLGPSLAADAGATSHELMAMWGWTTLAQAELYTRAADRKRLGKSAASRLIDGYSEAQSANTIPRTFDEGAGTERKAQ